MINRAFKDVGVVNTADRLQGKPTLCYVHPLAQYAIREAVRFNTSGRLEAFNKACNLIESALGKKGNSVLMPDDAINLLGDLKSLPSFLLNKVDAGDQEIETAIIVESRLNKILQMPYPHLES